MAARRKNDDGKSKRSGKKQLVSSTEVIQGYIFTVARRSIGRYGENLLTYLVKLAQAQFSGADFRHGSDIGKIQPDFDLMKVFIDKEGSAIVNIPIRELFPSDNGDYSNYTFVREQVNKLQREIINWEENGYWYSCQIIGLSMGKMSEKGKGNDLSIIKCKIDPKIWSAILNCSKGFSVYDFEIQKSLKRVSSVRFYQLFYRNPVTLRFGIDYIKSMFGIQKKYNRTYDLINRVVKPAKEELDQKSPWSFDYVLLVRDPGTGKLRAKREDGSDRTIPVVAIQFSGVHILANDNSETNSVESVSNPRLYLQDSTYHYLRDVLMFEDYEINSCREIFYNAQLLMDNQNKSEDSVNMPHLVSFLRTVKATAAHTIPADNLKGLHGYVINAVKNHLKEKYNFKYISRKQAPGKKSDKVDAVPNPSVTQKPDVPQAQDADFQIPIESSRKIVKDFERGIAGLPDRLYREQQFLAKYSLDTKIVDYFIHSLSGSSVTEEALMMLNLDEEANRNVNIAKALAEYKIRLQNVKEESLFGF